MEQGHVIRAGRIEELIETIRGGLHVRIETVDEASALRLSTALGERADMKNIVSEKLTVDCIFDGDRDALARLHREIVTTQEGVVSFYERRLTIEDVFMAVGSHKVS
jgi:hypothetical protein